MRSYELLKKTNNTYTKPIILYGGEILASANKTNKSKLETIQNKSLRIITGAVKTTPIAAMQNFTSNMSIKEVHEMKVVILVQKLHTNKAKHTWYHTAEWKPKQTSFKKYIHNLQYENMNINDTMPSILINPIEYLDI